MGRVNRRTFVGSAAALVASGFVTRSSNSSRPGSSVAGAVEPAGSTGWPGGQQEPVFQFLDRSEPVEGWSPAIAGGSSSPIRNGTCKKS